jgi:hypothetical protein
MRILGEAPGRCPTIMPQLPWRHLEGGRLEYGGRRDLPQAVGTAGPVLSGVYDSRGLHLALAPAGFVRNPSLEGGKDS